MRFISREEQLVGFIGIDQDAEGLGPVAHFLVGSRLARPQRGQDRALDDALLDGTPIDHENSARYWTNENEVHRARVLSSRVASTRAFLGPQALAVRDEVRGSSHFLIPETDQLALATFEAGTLGSRTILHRGFTQRGHLALRKHDGRAFVLHCSARDRQGQLGLFLDADALQTEARNVDFPYMAFSQAPIGHVARERPPFALLTYKCRDTGRLFLRRMEGENISAEKRLDTPPCLGGVAFGISGNKVVFSLDAIVDGKISPMIATSTDGGMNVTPFTPVGFDSFAADYFLPSSAPPAVDYLGNIQLPYVAVKGDRVHLLNVLEDAIVDAIVVDRKGYGGVTVAAFPKKSVVTVMAMGRGDGRTDGMGIIASAVSGGRLFAANSQAGGIHFPEERLLNHEMQRIARFKATDCYTRGAKPNQVSMDYVYLEAGDEGGIVSPQLYLETWDMPLPTPRVKAHAKGTRLSVEIDADAWFDLGKTTFEFSDPTIAITSMTYESDRKVILECDTDRLAGGRITFTMKNTFYFHEGSAHIEAEAEASA